MNKTIKLLWIDNDLYEDLNEHRIALYLSEKYEADFALNATDGFDMLRRNIYDIVIIDLRLPAGSHDEWKEYSEGDDFQNYGLALLKEVRMNSLLQHVLKSIIFIYSIEDKKDIPDIDDLLSAFPEHHYRQKTSLSGDMEFLDFLEQIHSNSL